MKKKIAGIGLGIAAVFGGLYAFLFRSHEAPKPQLAPVVTVVTSPSPTIEPLPEVPVAEIPTRTTIRTLASISAGAIPGGAAWTFLDTGAVMQAPAGLYRVDQSFTPPTTDAGYTTGLENYGGYQPCNFNSQSGFAGTPCAIVFLQQKVRWVVLKPCVSGQVIGNPPTCYAVNGMAGKSGKSK